MSAQSAMTAVLSPPARRAAAMVVAFAVAGPPVAAALYLGIYAMTRRVILGIWDVPTVQDFVDYLPDIYTFGIAAALVAGLAIGWRQTKPAGATPAFLLAAGLLVGLANAAVLLAIAPDFGPPEIAISILIACHTLAFVLTTIVCWRLGDLLGHALGGGAS